ncbi:MAG: lysine--tRNA ligase [bacterium]|nr:lysine--tRNA ligase [bacterium]
MSSEFQYNHCMREDLITTREEHVKRLQDAGRNLYPTWNGRTHSVTDIHEQSEVLISDKTVVTTAGRLSAKRKHGGSTFADIVDGGGKIQIWIKRDLVGVENYTLIEALDLGDIVAFTGAVIKTEAGELTVQCEKWELLTKSLTPLPDTWYGLKDVEVRARQRELDLLINKESRETFVMRSKIIQAMREFLLRNNFMEVETPVLQSIAGGASARPFTTHHNALDLDLFLRISPELYLKRMVVGGFERVFEVARNFRNEGVDRQHNPEFTMCEFYMAYANIDDLISLSEKMFSAIFSGVGKGDKITYQGVELDFKAPWKQISYVDTIKKETGIDVLEDVDPQIYINYMNDNNFDLPESKSLPALVDTLFKEAIRKKVVQPVIVRDFPTYMEPLAKRVEGNPKLVQRAQLVAMGAELFKAYTELNDPIDQEKRFIEQERYREAGDAEAQHIDQAFLTALKIGLPPTAGWGMGIDRLTMLLTDQSHIRDVITFPLMRPETDSNA